MTFTLEVRVREEVGAWGECEGCKGRGYITSMTGASGERCEGCKGTKGKWHEAVKAGLQFYEVPSIEGRLVTKSSTLYRFHDACSVCRGDKTGREKISGTDIYARNINTNCKHCHVDGIGSTGCEPGTATGWEVKG